MLLHQPTEEAATNPTAELRLDRETADKVTALALCLQEKRGATLSVREIEEAGKEVGLEPQFVHEALAQVRQTRRQTADTTSRWMQWGKVIHPAWWASGWAFPVMLAAGAEGLHIPDGMVGAAFIGAMGVYVGFGVVLSMVCGDQPSKPLSDEERDALLRSFGNWGRAGDLHQPAAPSPSSFGVSTSAVSLPGSAHLCVIPRMAHDSGAATDFAVWALSLIRREGGELLSATAEGIECRFPTADAAIRAARHLQEEASTLTGQISVRDVACGVATTGPASRQLALTAVTGDVVIDEDFAGEGLRELGRLARIENGPRGALSWKAGGNG